MVTLTFKYFECGTDLEFYEPNLYLNLTRSVESDYESDVGKQILAMKAAWPLWRRCKTLTNNNDNTGYCRSRRISI